MAQKQIRESLLEQLRMQNKTQEFYKDLVNDYMSHWKLKQELMMDIKKRGFRYEAINGNGVRTEKPNESVERLQKETATMLKILSDLNLKEPLSVPNAEDDYL